MADIKLLDKFFKFKVGEMLAHRGSIAHVKDILPYRFSHVRYVIVGREIEQCSGGIQIFYTVRGNGENGLSLQIIRINEVEFIAWDDKFVANSTRHGEATGLKNHIESIIIKKKNK